MSRRSRGAPRSTKAVILEATLSRKDSMRTGDHAATSVASEVKRVAVVELMRQRDPAADHDITSSLVPGQIVQHLPCVGAEGRRRRRGREKKKKGVSHQNEALWKLPRFGG